MKNNPSINAAELFTVVGEKTRLQIIRKCFSGKQSVENLLESLGVEKTLLSKHLKVLRDAGILVAEKDGRFISYSLNKKICHNTLRNTLALHCCNIELKN